MRNKTGQPDGSSDFHVDLAIKAIWRFLSMGDPQMVKWLVIMENPIKMNDLGVPPF